MVRERLNKVECGTVWKVPEEERCDWVKETPSCNPPSYFPYVIFLFCKVGTQQMDIFHLAVMLLLIWILYLFLIMGTTADNFFVPNLSITVDIFQFTESFVGIVILAFGQNAPELIQRLAALDEEEHMIIFSELVGSGLFELTFLLGSVVLYAPIVFTLHPLHFMRDALFYLVTTAWLFYVVFDHKVYRYEALSCILIYILYVVFVIMMQRSELKERAIRRKAFPIVQDPSIDELFKEEDRRRRKTEGEPTVVYNPHTIPAIGRTKLDVAIKLEMRELNIEPEPVVDEKRPKGLFREFLYDITPIQRSEWVKANCFMKIMQIWRIPFMICLMLMVPTVNRNVHNHGWSKLLNCMQICLTPLIIVGIMRLWHTRVFSILLWQILMGISTFFAVIVFMTTSAHRIPKYHQALGVLGFFKSCIVVWGCANEVMACLEAIGFASGLSDTMLGLTLLAWGNNIGDLIANVTIARYGFMRMGVAACFGGPLFNTLVGMGTLFLVSTTNESDWILMRTGTMAPGMLLFLSMSLIGSLIYLNCTGFICRKGYAYFLYALYASFLIMIILAEAQIIHPLGSDYRPDDDD